MRRIIPVLVVLVATIGVAAFPGLASDEPVRDGAAEAATVDAINDERADRGLRAIPLNTRLSSIARAHSVRMAERGDIYHNSSLPSQVPEGWTALAENVGQGPNWEGVHQAFMQSADHRENILGRFTELGVGIVQFEQQVWVTHVFVERPARTVTKKQATTVPEPRVLRRERAPATSGPPEPVRTRARAPRIVAAPEPEPPVAEQTMSSLERMTATMALLGR